MRRSCFRIYLLWLLSLAPACSVNVERAASTISVATTPAPVASPPAFRPAAPPSTATATPQPAPSATSGPRVCSPLRDIPLAQVGDLVSNPYHPPPPGYDDPHAGVDLADRLTGSQVAVAGREVQAALPGRVAMLLRDRFPFGNAILIETPLENEPAGWWLPAGLPAPAPTLAPLSALTCPTASRPVLNEPGKRSLYVLYAHLEAPPGLSLGEAVTCGQALGAVGDTGNALNPHLHFKARAGPAGLQFQSMAHYDASATPDEMRSYCLWTVSGVFQLVDPMKVLQLSP